MTEETEEKQSRPALRLRRASAETLAEVITGSKFELYRIVKGHAFLKDKDGNERRLALAGSKYADAKVGDTLTL